MFWRLLTVADDFGIFQADVDLIRSACFPRTVDKIKISQVEKWFADLVNCELLTAYVVKGKKYAIFNTWEEHNRRRNKNPKWPLPSSADTCQQMPANDDKRGRSATSAGLSEVVSESSIRSSNKEKSAGARDVDDEYIEVLKRNPAYRGIDFDREFGKMQAFFTTPKGKGRTLTRRFLVNWLNRCDVPIAPPLPPATNGKYAGITGQTVEVGAGVDEALTNG